LRPGIRGEADSGGLSLECSTTDLAAPAAALATQYAEEATRAGVELVVEPPDRPVLCWVDERRLDRRHERAPSRPSAC
jgi:hypothetical protein